MDPPLGDGEDLGRGDRGVRSAPFFDPEAASCISQPAEQSQERPPSLRPVVCEALLRRRILPECRLFTDPREASASAAVGLAGSLAARDSGVSYSIQVEACRQGAVI